MNSFLLSVIAIDMLAIGVVYLVSSFLFNRLYKSTEDETYFMEKYKIKWILNILAVFSVLYVNIDIIANKVLLLEDTIKQFKMLNHLTVINISILLIMNIDKVGLFRKAKGI